MNSRWKVEAGKLQCAWADVAVRIPYSAPWMADDREAMGSYLEPVPDFASHSPFGGPEWFELHCSPRSAR